MTIYKSSSGGSDSGSSSSGGKSALKEFDETKFLDEQLRPLIENGKKPSVHLLLCTLDPVVTRAHDLAKHLASLTHYFPYGATHVAVLVGSVVLEWGIHKGNQQSTSMWKKESVVAGFLLEGPEVTDSHLLRVAALVADFQKHKTYSFKNPNPTASAVNCQAFGDALLAVLERTSDPLKDHNTLIGRYVKAVITQSRKLQMRFDHSDHPYLNLPKLSSHADYDNHVQKLLEDPKHLKLKGSEAYKLLMSWHLALMLREGQTADCLLKPGSPPFKYTMLSLPL